MFTSNTESVILALCNITLTLAGMLHSDVLVSQSLLNLGI